jgi:hypothetical protein
VSPGNQRRAVCHVIPEFRANVPFEGLRYAKVYARDSGRLGSRCDPGILRGCSREPAQ